MDHNKKLSEALLKADGIDPAKISEAERDVFREMLDNEKKRMKRLSWVSVGAVWMFAIVLLGLIASEKILELLHVPFVVGIFVVAAVMWFVNIRYVFPRNRMIKESNKKISKLHYLVYGKHRGFAMVSRKDEKRIIHWPRIILITAGLCLFMSLGGAGVYYLLCQRWIYSTSPWFHIFYCTAISLSLVLFGLREGLKAPLEELAEVKSKPSKPKDRPEIWRTVMHSSITKYAAAAVIIIGALIGTNMLNGTPAWADVLEEVKKAKSVYYKSTSQLDDFSWSNEVMINQEGVQRDVLNDGGNIHVFDFRNGFELQLNTQCKTAYRTVRTPQPHMKLFNSLDFLASRHEKGNVRFVDYEVIDGIEAEVYEDIHPLQHSRTTIWIDPETKLPMRVVTEDTPPMDAKYLPIKNISMNSNDFGYNKNRSISGRLSGSCTPLYRKQIMADFKWNIDLDPSMFSTEIPPGYEQHEQELPFEPSEADLIETLRFWAEVSNEMFPVDVNDLMDPNTIEPMIVETFKKGIDPKQEFEDAADFMNTVRWAASFAERKIIKGNWYASAEPVYLSEADKPLYWWKLEDSEMYRVIYGDLTVEDVAPENLPESFLTEN